MATQRVIKGYRLDRQLGAGGMGTVYVAEKLTTHQQFAFKLMQEQLLDDHSQVARFEREINHLRAIRHPNVVDVFEWSLPTSGGEEPPFIVMELLEGEGLDRLLKRQQRIDPATSVEIVLQLLDGLAAAHEIGVIHRDLGPSNVFLEPLPNGKFHVKVLDFGLARPFTEESDVTQAGTLMGKPAYVAPEIFIQPMLDAASDIFSCGILLYRMVTGRFPYREIQSQMLWVERYAERYSTAEYPSPRTFAPELPEGLERVIVRAIARNPRERFESAREMQGALLDVEASLGPGGPLEIAYSPRVVNEPSSTVAGRSAQSLVLPPRRRSRWIAGGVLAAGIAAAAVVLLLGGGGGGDESPAVAPPVEAAAVEPSPPEAAAGAKAESVHFVLIDAPPESIARIGTYSLSGEPPEGDVPKGSEPLELVVAAEGFETWKSAVVPDRHRSVRIEMVPIAGTVMEFPDESSTAEPDAGESAVGEDAGPSPRDPGHSVVFRDAGTRGEAGGASAGRDAGAPPADAAPVAARDAGTAPPLDAGGPAGRIDASRLPVDLPDDPFGGPGMPEDPF